MFSILFPFFMSKNIFICVVFYSHLDWMADIGALCFAHIYTIRIHHNIWQSQEREIGVSLSNSTIKRRLHECKYREFTTMYKPLVKLKNRKARLDIVRKRKKACSVLEKESLDRWNQDELLLEWWEEKSLEKERNGS